MKVRVNSASEGVAVKQQATNAELKPRSTKGRRTRARLIDAGQKVFERDGFLNARITDIAEQAGVSHGSFYHYFPSKEAIFREIAQEQEVRLLAIDDGHERFDDPIDGIRWANQEYLRAYRDAVAIMRVIEEVTRYDTIVSEDRVARWQRFAGRLEGAIKRLQTTGDADASIDAWYAANALGGMVAKFAEMWFIQGENYDFEQAVEQLTRLWANALGMGDTRAANANLTLDLPSR